MSSQDLFSQIDKLIDQMTSDAHQLETFLTTSATQYVREDLSEDKFYLLKRKLERAVVSQDICGHILAMLFAQDIDYEFFNPDEVQ